MREGKELEREKKWQEMVAIKTSSHSTLSQKIIFTEFLFDTMSSRTGGSNTETTSLFVVKQLARVLSHNIPCKVHSRCLFVISQYCFTLPLFAVYHYLHFSCPDYWEAHSKFLACSQNSVEFLYLANGLPLFPKILTFILY